MKAAVYSGTRNLYKSMVAAAKSLLIHSDVEKIYFLIEDDQFPYELPSEIECINVSNQTFFNKNGPNYKTSWTYMALMKAAYSKIFPQLDTILSLDVDTIINENISDLWNIDISKYYIAAVKEPQKSYGDFIYINIGVALFNLKKIRNDKKDDEIIHLLNSIKLNYPEQDCINILCQNYIYPLSPNYNITNYTIGATHKKIIHYAAVKNWQDLPLFQKYYQTEIQRNKKDIYNLDIIIPTYNNKNNLIRTLKSIINYNNIKITVVDDASPESYKEEILKIFPYINWITLEKNSGPGVAREIGIQNTTNSYIMFIDAGDYLYSSQVLNKIMTDIKNNTLPDIYLYQWYNEENGQFSTDWNPLLHGHVYKREFLELYNIHFCAESSYSNEDIGFNHICDMVLNHINMYDTTEHKVFYEYPIYFYTYDRNSITHINGKEYYYTKQIQGLALNAKHVIETAEKDNINLFVLLNELNALFAGLYESFLLCAKKRPDLLFQNWPYIRQFYFETYQQYENKSEDALSIAIGQKLKHLLRAGIKNVNIKRFIKDLKENEIVPTYYLT